MRNLKKQTKERQCCLRVLLCIWLLGVRTGVHRCGAGAGRLTPASRRHRGWWKRDGDAVREGFLRREAGSDPALRRTSVCGRQRGGWTL